MGSACPCLALCPAQKPRWSPLPKILGFGGSFLLARPPPLHLLVSRPCHHRIPACLLRLSHPRALVPQLPHDYIAPPFHSSTGVPHRLLAAAVPMRLVVCRLLLSMLLEGCEGHGRMVDASSGNPDEPASYCADG